MKVIKDGKKKENSNKKYKKFTCSGCGCEFEASEDEYWKDEGIRLNGNYLSLDSNVTEASCIIAHTKYYCNCPQCHTKCYNYEPRPGISISDSVTKVQSIDL